MRPVRAAAWMASRRGRQLVVGDHHLDLDLGQEVDDVLGAAVELGVALLAAVALGLQHGHALDAQLLQGLLHLVQLERLDHRLDLLHSPRPGTLTPALGGPVAGALRSRRLPACTARRGQEAGGRRLAPIDRRRSRRPEFRRLALDFVRIAPQRLAGPIFDFPRARRCVDWTDCRLADDRCSGNSRQFCQNRVREASRGCAQLRRNGAAPGSARRRVEGARRRAHCDGLLDTFPAGAPMSRVYLIRHARPSVDLGRRRRRSGPRRGRPGAGRGAPRRRCWRCPRRCGPPAWSPRRCGAAARPPRRSPPRSAPRWRSIPASARSRRPPALAPAERGPWLRKAFGGRWSDIEGDLDYDAWRAAGRCAAAAARADTAVFSHFVAINAVLTALAGEPQVIAFRPDHCSISVFELERRRADAGRARRRGGDAGALGRSRAGRCRRRARS